MSHYKVSTPPLPSPYGVLLRWLSDAAGRGAKASDSQFLEVLRRYCLSNSSGSSSMISGSSSVISSASSSAMRA